MNFRFVIYCVPFSIRLTQPVIGDVYVSAKFTADELSELIEHQNRVVILDMNRDGN